MFITLYITIVGTYIIYVPHITIFNMSKCSIIGLIIMTHHNDRIERFGTVNGIE